MNTLSSCFVNIFVEQIRYSWKQSTKAQTKLFHKAIQSSINNNELFMKSLEFNNNYHVIEYLAIIMLLCLSGSECVDGVQGEPKLY